MASKHWEAMPANDGPDIDAGAWQVFRILDTGEEQWLGGTGDKDEMEWTAQYVEAIEVALDQALSSLRRIKGMWQVGPAYEAIQTLRAIDNHLKEATK